jgi:non-ribosomal peptide synthetase component F/acyl carrier protein
MVVLRSDLSGDPTFAELIERTADNNLDLYEHQEVPFYQVVDAVQPVRDPDRNPLFQVSVQLLTESTSGESLGFPGVTAEFLPLGSLESRFDISLNLIDTGSSLRASVEHSAEMFDGWRIAAMLTHLETVLRAAAADPGRRLSQLPIVPPDEADRLLAAGADPRAYVVDRTMNLLPRGVPGELLVGAAAGDALPDPFRPGERVRRTGELARWTRDLRLERLGSLDAERELRARLNRGAAAPEPTATGDDFRTVTERSVAGIFGEVLSLPTVGAEDSFFDVGGNSLQAMRAVSRINKGFGIKLSVRALYGNGTVRAVSAVVDEKVGGGPA